jgi:acyl carrier protein
MKGAQNRLREFISKEIMLERGASSVTTQTALVGGVLDSLGLMQLVSYIQEEFGVTLEDAEVTPENFRTVREVERLVAEKVLAKERGDPATHPQAEANPRA